MIYLRCLVSFIIHRIFLFKERLTMKYTILIFLFLNFAHAQGFECDNNFGDCGTPEQSGGGGGGKGSVLIANTDLGDTYQHADDYDGDGIKVVEIIDKRLELIGSLNRVVRDPMLLKSDTELSEAIKVVAELTDLTEKSDETAAKIQELINYISLARVKIPVLFLSDNESKVIIERFKSLGQFQQLEIDLLPGRYTVTSSRSGFRDIRTEVLVFPGSTENQFYIANTEPVR